MTLKINPGLVGEGRVRSRETLKSQLDQFVEALVEADAAGEIPMTVPWMVRCYIELDDLRIAELTLREPTDEERRMWAKSQEISRMGDELYERTS